MPEIRNCTIVNNFPGGLFTSSWDGMNVTNTILWGNDRYQIYDERIDADGYVLRRAGRLSRRRQYRRGSLFPQSCRRESESNTTALPPIGRCGPARRASIAGRRSTSFPPTDLAGAERIHSDVIDLGAYENQSDLPLMTATPSTTVDAGFVAVNASKTVVVELSNTGKLDFKIVDTSVPNGAFSIGRPIQNKVLAPGGVRPGEDPVPADAGEGVHGHADSFTRPAATPR